MNFAFLIILTKSDKLNKTERSKRLDEIKEELRDYEGVEVIPFSAVTGEGVEKIRKQIDKYTESE
jgi:GTP-binding protein